MRVPPFSERYALRLESELGTGTTAIMTVPNLVGEDRLQDGRDATAAAAGALG